MNRARGFLVAITLSSAVTIPGGSPVLVEAAGSTTIDGLYAGTGGLGATATVTIVT